MIVKYVIFTHNVSITVIHYMIYPFSVYFKGYVSTKNEMKHNRNILHTIQTSLKYAHQHKHINHEAIGSSEESTKAGAAQILGVYIDNHLTFSQHIDQLCTSRHVIGENKNQ